MSNRNGPCLHCTERQPGCHGACDKYAEYKRENDADNKREKAERIVRDYERERDAKFLNWKAKQRATGRKI